MPDVILENIVGSSLKDSSSAQWGPAVYMTHNGLPVLCGSVNAKNSFGGRNGMVRFISLGTPQTTWFQGQTPHFSRGWRTWCSKADL